MPATTTDYSKIKSYQEEAASLNKQAAGMESTAFTLPDTVMNAVRADRTTRGVSKLATDVGNVMGQMVTDPNAIREGPQSLSQQGLVDPFSVNQLTSNARAQNLRTLGTVATEGNRNQAGIAEIISAGANQLRARAANIMAQAEEATAMATALQGEFERDITEREMALKEQGSGGSDWGSIFADWLNKNNKDDFVEEPFDYSQAVSKPTQPETKKFSFLEGAKAVAPALFDTNKWVENKVKSTVTKLGANWALGLLKRRK